MMGVFIFREGGHLQTRTENAGMAVLRLTLSGYERKERESRRQIINARLVCANSWRGDTATNPLMAFGSSIYETQISAKIKWIIGNRE
jgi:hypothetical protein